MASSTISTVIIRNLLNNEDFARAVVPHFKEEYLEDAAERAIMAHIRELFVKHNTVPTTSAIKVCLESSNLDQTDFASATELIESIEAYDGNNESTEWLVAETEKFCQERALFNALLEAITIKDGKSKKDKHAIPEILKEALGVSLHKYRTRLFCECG